MTLTPTNKISNTNYLIADSFKFQLVNYPNVSFFGTSFNLPGISLGDVSVPTKFVNMRLPGNKVTFDPVTIRFQVNEDLSNWLELYQWLLGLGFPESFSQFVPETEYTEANLILLTNKKNPILSIKFHYLFIQSLGSLPFENPAPVGPVMVDATFAYQHFTIDRSI